jgi:hypothetical protein
MLTKIILSILTVLFILCGLIAFGLYSMEIEDHYRDLQQVYFDSENGDIIINKRTHQFGIITKNWKRADIITNEKDTLDLYELIYTNQIENKYEVFRSENELKIKELTFEKILDLRKKNLLETVIKN